VLVSEPALVQAVSRFVGDVGAALQQAAEGVKGIDAARLVDDAATEAFNLAAAFVDSDSRHSDAEIHGLMLAFAAHGPAVLPRTAPAQIRESGMLAGRAGFLDRPSTLLDILVTADSQRATDHSTTYYERAMDVAHAVCALDALPSRDELAALDRFRTMIIRTREQAGVGRPRPTAGQAVDAAAAATAPEQPLPPARPLDEVMRELDALIGLEPVKAEVKLVADLIQIQKLRAERDLPVVETSRHLVFTGNPGTGKTTVARLLAEIYRSLGVVERGHLVETDRSGLVAGYVGQTAIQVRAVFEEALGGVLLIDEAYALARGGERDFGIEAIDTLVKLIEDHRDDIAVIAAGYPDEMRVFIDSNPGLRSRFPKTIHFPDYSTAELLAIFEAHAERSRYVLTPAAREALADHFDAQVRDKGFGNGRVARNLFESAIARQASRLVMVDGPTDEQLCTLERADVLPDPAS
jgi:Cdc6-like AAA superfamily ATPase